MFSSPLNLSTLVITGTSVFHSTRVYFLFFFFFFINNLTRLTHGTVAKIKSTIICFCSDFCIDKALSFFPSKVTLLLSSFIHFPGDLHKSINFHIRQVNKDANVEQCIHCLKRSSHPSLLHAHSLTHDHNFSLTESTLYSAP